MPVTKRLSSATALTTEFRDVYQGVERKSTGYRMLMSMGWNEGEGLGSKKQGIKSHIRTSKKIDNAGVGIKAASAKSEQWTVDMHLFTRMLQSLPEITAATSSAPVVKPARPQGPLTEAPTASARQVTAASVATSESSESDSEDECNRVLKRAKVGHEGRYAKRELSKNLKKYSAQDLAAILGHVPASVDHSSAGVLHGSRLDSAKKETIAVTRLSYLANEMAVTRVKDRPDDASAWWYQGFRRGGVAGDATSKAQSRQAAIHSGFSEKDQEDLYTRSQGGKSQGRSGLGVGSLPKRVAGVRWEGAKTTFDCEDSGGDTTVKKQRDVGGAGGDLEGYGPQGCVDVLPGGSMVVWPEGGRPSWFPKRGGAADCLFVKARRPKREAEDSTSALSPDSQRICKRVVRRALKQGTGGVCLQALVKEAVRLILAAGEKDKREVKAQVRRFLKDSSKRWAVREGILVAA